MNSPQQPTPEKSERKRRMAELLAIQDRAIAEGARTYTLDEISRARDVGWEEVDAIKDNLERLESLNPGATVTLRSGERYVMDEFGWWKDRPAGDQFPMDHWGEYMDHDLILPLLKACVEAGGVVTIAGEAGGTAE